MRKETYKSVGKKVLASALSAAMVVAFAPAVALADVAGGNDVAAYSDDTQTIVADYIVTNEDGLRAAIDEASDGQKIALASDIVLNERLDIGKKVILDLGDYVLSENIQDKTENKRAIKLTSGADVTIDAVNGGVTAGCMSVNVASGAKLTINGGIFTAPYAVAAFSSSSEKAEVEINGGVFNGWLYTNGTGHDDHFTINNGTFNKQLYFASGDRSTYKINGGVFNTGNESTIEIDGGSLDITGGEFSCSVDTSDNVNKPATNNNGSGAYNGVLVVCKPDGSSKTGYIGDVVVNITGGVFKHANADAEAIVVADFGSEDAAKGAGDAKVTVSKDAEVTGKIVMYKSEGNTGASLSTEGGTFSDIAGAVEYAANNAALKLAKDATLSSALSIDESMSIDLNGHTLTFENGGFDIAYKNQGAKLDLKNGTVNAQKWCAWLQNSGSLTVAADLILNGNLSGAGDKTGIAVTEKSTLNVYGTVTSKASSAISGNGSKGMGDTTINIFPGAVITGEGSETAGIYHPQSGTLNIEGGTISGSTGIQLCAGKGTIAQISGSTIVNGTGIDDRASKTGDGFIQDGSAISIVNRDYPGGTPLVNISGGTFTSANTETILAYDWKGNKAAEWSASTKPAAISAGAFSNDPDAAYKADGTETHEGTDGMFHVHAVNADVRYGSSKDATCTEPGYTSGSYCGIDGATISSSETIPALGHKSETIAAVAPTCTETGLTEGTKCSVCGEVLSGQEVVPALGHEAGEYVVTTPATETTEGVATSTCTRCGEVVDTKAVEKLKPAGTEESGKTESGETVDVTVADNTPGETESGTKYVGSVEYNGSQSGSTGQPSSEEIIPETVEVNGSTYAVTKIADEAFKDQEQLKSVSIPSTVIEVGKSAFEGTGVESIVIPEATAIIGKAAFKDCDSLKTADIKSTALKEIPASAFEGCASLATANIPATVEKVGSKAFAGTALVDLILPEATIDLGASAFQNCKSLSTVEIKGDVTELSSSLFKGAKALETVSLPASLTTIGASAFEDTAIKSLTLPSKVKAIGSKAFASTPITSIVPAAKTTMATAASNKGKLVLPAGLSSLGASAFASCKSLKSVALPSKIKTLATSTFSGCSALTCANVASVTTIGKSAFSGDKALKSFTTGSKLTTIGSSALSGAKKLGTLNVKSKKLTKKGVKGSLKGSSVKTVKVKASKSKKTNKKYIAKYKKYFAKKNSGKKVTVK